MASASVWFPSFYKRKRYTYSVNQYIRNSSLNTIIRKKESCSLSLHQHKPSHSSGDGKQDLAPLLERHGCSERKLAACGVWESLLQTQESTLKRTCYRGIAIYDYELPMPYRCMHTGESRYSCQKTLNLAASSVILWQAKDQQRGGCNDSIPPRIAATRRNTRYCREYGWRAAGIDGEHHDHPDTQSHPYSPG
jgi:hypothetical protein